MRFDIEKSAKTPGRPLTRRCALAYGGASLAALPFAARAQALPSENRTALAAGARNLLTVAVTIAGAGPYRFVVDTGADRTVISDDVANALGLPRGKQASVVGIARTILADTVHAPRLEIDNLTKEGMDLPVLPRAGLGADGYLGLDVIDGHRVIFDFRNRKLILDLPRISYLSHIIGPDESRLQAGGSQGHLRTIDCEIDGVRAVAFLDTGADVSVGNMQLFEALKGARNEAAPTETVTLTGVTGGSVIGHSLAVEQLRLGGFDLSTSGMAIADLPIFDLWGLAHTPALFVGMDFLSGFSKVSIDYGLKEYRLELGSRQGANREVV